MEDDWLKYRFSETIEEKKQVAIKKYESKFDVLLSQAFRQVKRKMSNQEQNFPLIKMRSYQTPKGDEVQRKQTKYLTQRSSNNEPNPLQRYNSLRPISLRSNVSKQKKHPVNKILWQKKISLQSLRLSSTKNQSKNLLSLPKQSLKHLRQKTQTQPKDIQYEQDPSSQMLVQPANMLSSRSQKQRFLENKRKIEEKFKKTFLNNENERLGKKGSLHNVNRICFESKPFRISKHWDVDRDEADFVNFVKHQASTIKHS